MTFTLADSADLRMLRTAYDELRGLLFIVSQRVNDPVIKAELETLDQCLKDLDHDYLAACEGHLQTALEDGDIDPMDLRRMEA